MTTSALTIIAPILSKDDATSARVQTMRTGPRSASDDGSVQRLPHALLAVHERLGLIVVGLTAVACSADVAKPLAPAPSPPKHAALIHAPPRLSGITRPARGENPSAPRTGNVACKICHSLRTPAALPAGMHELDTFHQGLVFAHGGLTCGSCHLLGDQSALRRADGTAVALGDAIELCRQCHGPQARDYDHGAHGGMTGHWDLSRGGQVRNHCVDCHDAHAPQIRTTFPVLPPADRGLLRGRPSAAADQPTPPDGGR